MQAAEQKKTELPSEWIEKNFYVPDPRDPVTGELFPPGPIVLADHQRRIINEALSKTKDGLMKYSTIIYSAPKKSGKSALSAGVALYMAYHNSNSYIALLANDKKQSDDRLYGPILTNFRIHRQQKGLFKDVKDNKTETVLENYTKIEAVPCDAPGEAGSQPLATFWSELWGFETDLKRRLWTEMTIPPTLYGRAIRWVESYAGYSGTSELLENLYDTAFTHGAPHPDFEDLQGRDGPVVRVNMAAGTFCYWDTEPRMVWQTPDYYKMEAASHPPSEFDRIHRNKWSSASGAFIRPEWWDACEDLDLPPLKEGDKTPMVVAIDMAETHDCAAMVGITRHPTEPKTRSAIRMVEIFVPRELGGTINQEDTVGLVIKDWFEKYNVLCWAYDPREMTKLAQDYSRAGFGWFFPFSQQTMRSVADKELYDMVVHRQIAWNSRTTRGRVGYKGMEGESLYRHLTQAGSKIERGSFRIEKLASRAFIDAAVATSMANHQVMKLALDNYENKDDTSLVMKLAKGEMTLDEFSKIMRAKYPQLEKQVHEQR